MATREENRYQRRESRPEKRVATREEANERDISHDGENAIEQERESRELRVLFVG